MRKTARSSKKTFHKRTTKQTHPLHRQVPTLNAFIVIFYVIVFILGVGIFVTK